MRTLLAFAGMVLMGDAASGCLSSAQAPNAVAAGLDFAVCVIGVYAHDHAAGQSDTAIVADAIAQCGGDAASVVRVLDSHKAAEIREQAAK